MTKNDQNLDLADVTLRRVKRILLLAGALAALCFLGSNFFFVEEGQVALISRFGRLAGGDLQVILPGGPHFAWPEPIDRIHRFPTTMQHLTLEKEFCSGNQSAFIFVPGEDGSLLTGDKNLVQGKWSMDYLIDAPRITEFAVNIGTLEQARAILRDILARAVIRTVSGMTVDDFIKGNIDNDAIKNQVQLCLDQVHSGIRIQHVTCKSYTVPVVLQDIFQAVNRSESEKALQVEQARRYREARLNAVFGKQWPQALAAIAAYESSGSKDSLQTIFRTGASGDVAKIIDEANLYRTATVQDVKAKVERFQKLLQEHRRTPEILRNRLLQDAVQEIFSRNVRKFYLPESKDKTIYLQLAP